MFLREVAGIKDGVLLVCEGDRLLSRPVEDEVRVWLMCGVNFGGFVWRG